MESTYRQQSLGDRLKWAREQLSLTQKELGDICGYDQTQIGNIEDGTTKNPRKLDKLAKAVGKSEAWLRYGYDEIKEPSSSEYSSNLHDDRIALQSEVPLISSVQAGQWNDIMDMYHPGDGEELIPTTKRVSSGSFALRVSGDSMTCDGPGSIYEGMIVIVDPQVEPLNGRIVVAKLKSSQEATIKKLVIDGPNGYLMPLNKRYSPIPIDEDCLIIGTVVKVEFDI